MTNIFAVVTGIAVLAFPGMAEAHMFGAQGAGLGSGLAHPFSGVDHLLAMFAVGLWAARLGGRFAWLLPVGFLLGMSAGGALALVGGGLPLVEPGIVGSVMLLGAVLALDVRVAPATGLAMVAGFALFHGYGHGTEIPEAAAPLAYAIGFITSTAILHAAGLAAGYLIARARQPVVAKLAGVSILGSGLALAVF
ncbi:MAG: HupE/UreJ family protein [Alphaproteobacteria bacterium]